LSGNIIRWTVLLVPQKIAISRFSSYEYDPFWNNLKNPAEAGFMLRIY